MKTWTTEHIFDHPFTTLTKAVWRKYPNPLKPEVLGSDVMERRVEDDGSLVTHRVIETNFGLPYWSRKLLGTESVFYGYEKSKVNPHKQIMSQVSRNVTFANTVTMGEKLTYSAYGDNQTKLVQESTVEVHGLPWQSFLEDTILTSVKNNINKGREALQWVVDRMEHEDKNNIVPDHLNGFGAQLNSPPDNQIISLEKLPAIDNIQKPECALAVANNLSDSVDSWKEKALDNIKNVDNLARQNSIIKSVDELGSKAIKSVDELAGNLCADVDAIGERARSLASQNSILKSVDDLGTKAIKSVDEFTDKARRSIERKSISETFSPSLLPTVELFDDGLSIS